MLLGTPITIGAGENRAPSEEELQTRAFFHKILPLPSDKAFLNLHRPWFRQGAGKPSFPGTAFDSVESASSQIHRANWISQTKGEPYEEFYYCISTQSRAEPKTSRSGNAYLGAIRSQGNAVGLKTIFADIDVKPRAFSSQSEAIKAVTDLVVAGDIPRPTVVVSSGNGIHMYWTLSRVMAPTEWEPLADGFGRFLKAKGIFQDSIFSNSVCLLRPPGSWHMKDKAAPKKVRLLAMLPDDYDPKVFEKYLSYRNVTALNPAGARAAAQPAQPPAVTTIPRPAMAAPPDWDAYLPRLPPIPPSGELSGGLDPITHGADMQAVLERCAVLNDVYARKGAGDPEPFWRLTLLAASFDPNGRAWAHELSKGHEKYTQAETDDKFNTILTQRAISGGRIGWPSCSTFNQHSSACQHCAFAGRVQSPLNLHANLTADDDLPPGYSRRQGKIWNDRASKSDDGMDIPEVAFPYNVRDAYLESTTEGPVLNIEILRAHESPRRLRMPVPVMNAWRERAQMILGQAGVALSRHDNTLAQEFFVAFVHHLQAAKAAVGKRDAVGWLSPKAGKIGFSYGGVVRLSDGTTANALGIDPALEERYTAQGELAPWQDAANFVIGMGRPDLQCILAAAFAAPLVKFTGMSGLMLSAYSPASGVQKSTAMQVAQAVWGHPTRAMNRIDDTGNSVANKLGTLRHLPIFWDELQSAEMAEATGFLKLIFALTQGTEKSRLTSDVQQRNSGSWATMLVTASNFSMQDLMMKQAKNTSAGLNRVFEVVVQPPPQTVLTSVAQANGIIARCQDNYGNAGHEYARILAGAESYLARDIMKIAAAVEHATGAKAEERFWVFTAATLFAGARMATQGGIVTFDLSTLWRYLIQTVKEQRTAKLTGTYDTSTAEYAAGILARFIQFARKNNAYLETNTFKPQSGASVIVEVKMTQDILRTLRFPIVHVAQDGRLRMLRNDFHEWLSKEGIPVRTVLDTLYKHGGMQNVRPIWAGGTEWSGARQVCYELILTGGTNPTDAVGNYFNIGAKT